MTNHGDLTPERWSRFTLPQQILQIGCEMQRGMTLLEPRHAALLAGCYERAIQLTELTAQGPVREGLRRKLMLWRSFVVDLSGLQPPDRSAHRAAFRALLVLNSETAKHIPLLGLD